MKPTDILGNIKLYNADCMEVMKTFKDKQFDLAIVDPPYRNQSENQPTKDMRRNGKIDVFGDKPDKIYFDELFRVSKNQIIWGANNFTLPNYKGFVIWKKLTISVVIWHVWFARTCQFTANLNSQMCYITC